MGDIRDSANATWREYEVDGVPSSGPHKPEKAAIIDTMGVVEDRVDAVEDLALLVSDGNGAGLITYATTSARNAAQPIAAGTTCQDLQTLKTYYSNGTTWVEIGPVDSVRLDTVEAAAEETARVLLRVRRDNEINANTFTNYWSNLTVGSINYTTGAEQTDATYSRTDFIPVTTKTNITRIGSAVASGTRAPLAFYDANKAHLGSEYMDSNIGVFSVANAPANTAYVRACGVTSTMGGIYIYDRWVMELYRDMLFSLLGEPEDVSGSLTGAYIHKSTGVRTSAGTYNVTDYIAVDAKSYLCSTADLIHPTSGNQCMYAFYGAKVQRNITAITKANPALVTLSASHDYADGQIIKIASVTGMTQINGQEGVVGTVEGQPAQFTIAINTTTYSDYVSGGTAESYPFLEAYSPVAENQIVRIGDINSSARFVRVTMHADGLGEVYVINSNPGAEVGLKMLLAGSFVDYFADPTFLEGGRLTDTGGLTQTTSDWWRTTKYIACEPGQMFSLTTVDATSLGPVVFGYDAAKAPLVAIVDPPTTNLDYTGYLFTIPEGVYFIKVTTRLSADGLPPYYEKELMGVRAPQESGGTVVTPTSNEPIYFAPTECYGRRSTGGDEPMYLFAQGIAPLPTQVAISGKPECFDEFQGTDKVRIERGSVAKWAEPDPVIKMRLMKGNTPVEIGTMTVRMSDCAALTTLGTKRHVLFIGDSTTSQLASDDSIDGDGTMVNEFGRQLTNAGDAGLVVGAVTDSEWASVVADDIRPAIAPAANIGICGTRGNGYWKHNGYGGWHPSSFLSRTNVIRMSINQAFVASNRIQGRITDGGGVYKTIDVTFATDSDTTLAALAAQIQDKMEEFAADALPQPNIPPSGGPGTGTPTATVLVVGGGSDNDRVIEIHPDRLTLDFTGPTDPVKTFTVTGGASQPTISKGDGKYNAFWDPDGTPWATTLQGDSKFSVKYMIEHWGYGYHVTNNPTGVQSDGSNLTVVVSLGWNPWGNPDASDPVKDMADLLDRIHYEYPQADVWLCGLWAPPNVNFKANTGTVWRYYTQQEVFLAAVKKFGDLWKALCDDSDRSSWAQYVHVAHQMDPDYCMSKSSMAPNRFVNDDTYKVYGVGDFVHMRRRGYTQWASVLADKFIYDYLRS